MFGLKFRNASNNLIVVNTEFDVLKRDELCKHYRFISGPNNSSLSIEEDIRNASGK